MIIKARRGLASLALVGLVAACSHSALAGAPPVVRSALDPFISAGYACQAHPPDVSGYAQWQCDGTSSDGSVNSVILDASQSAVVNVLATSHRTAAPATGPDGAGAFFDRVTDIPLGVSVSTIKDWVNGNLMRDGQAQFGPVFVTLEIRPPLTTLNLFASPDRTAPP